MVPISGVGVGVGARGSRTEESRLLIRPTLELGCATLFEGVPMMKGPTKLDGSADGVTDGAADGSRDAVGVTITSGAGPVEARRCPDCEVTGSAGAEAD